VRTLVVDDERLACEALARMLASDPDLEVLQSASGEEACALLREEDFDLLFLEIRMRGMSGFDVVSALEDNVSPPLVIFTTAYGEHAVEAFAVRAFDYLMKPIAADRLNEAVRRGKEAVRMRRLHLVSQQLTALFEDGTMAPSIRHGVGVPRFLIRSGRSTYSVEASAIDWIESADNYSRLWTADKSHLVRESMQTIEQQLAPHGFVRAHRTAIVNLRRVKEVRATRAGGYFAVLESGVRVPVSRDRRAALLDAMRQSASDAQ
jgi:two-component system LytT family response regulator